jgi:hypothetical protein
VDSAKASRKTNFALKSFHKKSNIIQKTIKIIYIFYIFYYYGTFHELHKHRFVMQRLQNPPLCGSIIKSKQLKPRALLKTYRAVKKPTGEAPKGL